MCVLSNPRKITLFSPLLLRDSNIAGDNITLVPVMHTQGHDTRVAIAILLICLDLSQNPRVLVAYRADYCVSPHATINAVRPVDVVIACMMLFAMAN